MWGTLFIAIIFRDSPVSVSLQKVKQFNSIRL